MRLFGGRSGTASSRCPTSLSPSSTAGRNSIGGSGGSGCAPSSWTRAATRTAPRSPSGSTASRSSSRAPTGSPTTTCSPGSRRERLARRLDQALGANLNLLRVWGGGIYESDDFYEPATRRASWSGRTSCWPAPPTPRRSRTGSEFEAEARENVARLAPHPSLVLWNGGNENLWGHEDWGWQERLGGRTLGSPATTTSSSRGSLADSTRPALLRRQPVLPGVHADSSTRTIPTTAPTTSGRSGTAWTTPLPRRRSPGSAPSSVSRARPPGRTLERPVHARRADR